jgi:adenylate kinase
MRRCKILTLNLMAEKNQQIILVLGPPGAGKGTQSDLLQEEFKLGYIGSGELLRARKLIDDFTGRKIIEVMDVGKRIPTPIIFKLWMDKFEELKQSPVFQGFVLDGSPRTILEAEMVEQALEWYGWVENIKIIFINLSEQDCIDRLTKRRTCKQCSRIIPYIGEFKKLEKCDECGGELFVRADDEPDDIKERLGWYREEVLPVVDHYRQRGILIEINGDQSIEKVYQDILEKLK